MLRSLSTVRNLAKTLAAAAPLVTALAAPASAQQAENPTILREAETRFEEGRILFSQRRYAEAHVKFEQACAVHRTINCAKNLGLTEYELGQYVESTTHLRDFLRAAKTAGPGVGGLDPGQLDIIQRRYNEAFTRCGHIEVDAPSGAKIVVGGKTIGRAPIPDPVDVMAGDHVVEAHTDHGVLRQNAHVGAGEVAPIRFVEAAKATPPPAPPPTDPRPDRPGSSSARTITLVSLYGVALIGAGTGIGLMLHADARSGDAEDKRREYGIDRGSCVGKAGDPRCEELTSLRDTYDTDRKWATVAFVGAGAIAAVATTMFFLWPRDEINPRERRAVGKKSGTVIPLVGPGTGGIGYVGQF